MVSCSDFLVEIVNVEIAQDFFPFPFHYSNYRLSIKSRNLKWMPSRVKYIVKPWMVQFGLCDQMEMSYIYYRAQHSTVDHLILKAKQFWKCSMFFYISAWEICYWCKNNIEIWFCIINSEQFVIILRPGPAGPVDFTLMTMPLCFICIADRDISKLLVLEREWFWFM